MHFVQAKGLLSKDNGMNIYRGCSHGCIYCDSRSKCYGFTHAFEDIEVKENAPELLERSLRSKRHKCMISTGAMCDPYLPAEKELQLTRKCLELIDQYDNIVFFGGAGVSTESGIPDFRSQDGLYNQKYDYPPETILSHTFYVNHTEEFYRFYRDKMLCLTAKPNTTHYKLAELEKAGEALCQK